MILDQNKIIVPKQSPYRVPAHVSITGGTGTGKTTLVQNLSANENIQSFGFGTVIRALVYLLARNNKSIYNVDVNFVRALMDSGAVRAELDKSYLQTNEISALGLKLAENNKFIRPMIGKF